MSDKAVIRAATIEDIRHFTNEPLSKTIRAWAVNYDGILACVAGAQRQGPRNMVAFSYIAEDVEKPRIRALEFVGRRKPETQTTQSVQDLSQALWRAAQSNAADKFPAFGDPESVQVRREDMF